MTGPRYAIIPGDAVTDDRLTPATFRVLAAIGRHHSNNGWCFFKQGKMASRLGLSRGAVNKAIANLTEWGYIEKRSTSRDDGGNSWCEYRVRLDRDDRERVSDEPEGMSSEDDTPLSSPEVTGVVTAEGDRPLSSPEVTARTSPKGTSPRNGSTAPPEPLDWVNEIRKRLGLPPPRNPFPELQTVTGWIRDGIDIEGVAWPTIEAVAQDRAERGNGEPITTIRYFDGPVRDSLRSVKGRPASGTSPPGETDEAKARRRRVSAEESGQWYAEWGDPPEDLAGKVKIVSARQES